MGKQSREKQERKQNGESAPIIEGRDSTFSSILKKVIFIGTGLALFTPFVVSGKYFFPFVGPKSIYFFALAEIIFAAWLILISLAPKYRPKLNFITVALLLFLLVAVLSTFLGIDPIRSFWSKYERMTGLLMYFHLFAFFLVASTVFRKKEEWLKIFGISVSAAVIMGCLALLNLTGANLFGNLSEATRGGALLGNSSFLGTYLLFNFFFALYLILNTRNLLKILSIAALGALLFALIFSTARAALLSTLGGAVLLGFLWMFFNGRKNFRLYGIILTAILIAGIVCSIYLATKPGNFVYDAVKNEVGDTFGGRLIVWEGAWKGVLEKPLLGWGPENFDYVFTKYFNSCMLGPNCGGDIWYDRAHNIVFDTLVMTGFLGLISYLGLFFAVFFALWKNFKGKNIGFWTAGIFTIVLISYFIQNLTVFDMVNSYVMFFLVLSFVAVFSSKEEFRGEKKPNALIIGAIIIIFLISFLKFVSDPLAADRAVIVSFSYPQASQQKLDFYENTLNISPVGRFQIVDFLTQNDLDFLQSQQASEASVESLKVMLDFDASKLENEIKTSPLDYRLHLRLGQVYNAYISVNDSSKFARAEEILNRAIELSPTNQQSYWALAQTKIYQGKADEALALAEKALSLEPQSRNGNLIVIQIAKIMGNDALIQQKAKEAVAANPALKADIESIFGIVVE